MPALFPTQLLTSGLDNQEIQEAFAQTLVGDYDSDQAWNSVRKLHHLGGREVFAIAATWCHSAHPLMRARGADVIAQLGKVSRQSNSFPEESFAIVAELVRTETEIQPLTSGLYALGHLENSLAIPTMCSYYMHPNSDVRAAVTFALGRYANNELAITALIHLTRDADPDVRDWAVFGLGVVGEADNPDIRDALAARLADANRDAREEAVVGLAKRQDRRVLETLLDLLAEPDVTDRVIEAASLMLGMGFEKPELEPSQYVEILKQRLL